MGVGIICPCLATLLPIFRHIRQRAMVSSRNGQSRLSTGTSRIKVLSQKVSGAFEPIGTAVDNRPINEEHLAYHVVIAQESHFPVPDTMPLAKIRVTRDVDGESVVEHA